MLSTYLFIWSETIPLLRETPIFYVVLLLYIYYPFIIMASRQYQADQIEQAVEKASSKRKVLVQLPTGGGKTYEFALLAQRFIRNSDQSVLIAVDRKELLEQARKTIKKLCNHDAYIINATTKKFAYNRIYICMVESLVNRTHLIHNVGLLIIDECHVANFNKLHSIFLEEFIIGYTATPISSSKKDPLNKYYNDIVVGPQISELISSGFLAQNVTRCPEDIVEASKLKVDSFTGDYNEKQMYEEYAKPKFVSNVVKNYMKFCEGKKTLVYNVNIEHSKLVNQAFVLMGFNSRHIDSNSLDRDENLQWFKETPDAILHNVGILTRGFDEPTIEKIIINFSTISIPKWLQCTGRGGRIIDQEFIDTYQHQYPYELNLKNSFEIIDMGGNAVSGLGDWNDDRDWKYIFENPEKPSEGGVAPTKICPSCEGLIHAALSVCPLKKEDGEFCQHEFERRKPKAEEDQEMVIITKGINIEENIIKYSNKHPYYNFLKMGEEVVNNTFANIKNPSETVLQKAFLAYYEMCIQWYKETLANVDGNIPDITFSDWHIKRARNNFNDLVKKKQTNSMPYDYTEMRIVRFCNGCQSHIDTLPDGEFCSECIGKLKITG